MCGAGSQSSLVLNSDVLGSHPRVLLKYKIGFIGAGELWKCSANEPPGDRSAAGPGTPLGVTGLCLESPTPGSNSTKGFGLDRRLGTE